MIEMRWVVTREQEKGCFSEPMEWREPCGEMSAVFVRLQYREKTLAGAAAWVDIPVVCEVTMPPALSLVKGTQH